MKILEAVLAVLTMAILAGVMAAQTPPAVQSFQIERVLDPNNLSSTFTPNFPSIALAGIQSGALEGRESINFNPQTSLLTVNLFTVQAGSPLPTPASTIISTTTFTILTIAVDRTYSVVKPNPALLFAGTVATNSPVSPFGNLTGLPATVSVGYTSDTPPKLNNVVVLIAGTVVDYSSAAAGALTFVAPPGPPTGGAGLTIVIVQNTSVYFREVTLDASGSTSPNGPLTFQWSVVAGNADIAFSNKAVATGYLSAGIGAYIFKVTVTDSKGNTASQTLTVNYY